MAAIDNKYFLDKKREDALKNLGFLGYNLYIDKRLTFGEMTAVVAEIKEAMARIQTFRQSEMHAAGLKAQEQLLDDKIMELGFMCYNFYIDKKIFNDEMLKVCEEIDGINNEIANDSGAGEILPSIIPEEEPAPAVEESEPLAGAAAMPEGEDSLCAPDLFPATEAAVEELNTPPVADYSTPPVADYSTPPVADYSTPPVADYSTPPVADYSTPPVADYSTPPVADYSADAQAAPAESIENWGQVMGDESTEGMEPIPEDFKRCMCGYKNKPYANFCGKCGARLA